MKARTTSAGAARRDEAEREHRRAALGEGVGSGPGADPPEHQREADR